MIEILISLKEIKFIDKENIYSIKFEYLNMKKSLNSYCNKDL